LSPDVISCKCTPEKDEELMRSAAIMLEVLQITLSIVFMWLEKPVSIEKIVRINDEDEVPVFVTDR